jgi:membrane protein implicated in regulation of membrane protease activity
MDYTVCGEVGTVDFLQRFFDEGWKLWLVAAVLFFLAEGTNAGTFALFFGGIGALATALACAFAPSVTENWTGQLLIFSAASILSLLLLRSALMRRLQGGDGELFTGPGAGLGERARALSPLRRGIEGRALYGGTEWRAMLAEDGEVPEGTELQVVKMEGLTLWVRSRRNDTEGESSK